MSFVCLILSSPPWNALHLPASIVVKIYPQFKVYSLCSVLLMKHFFDHSDCPRFDQWRIPFFVPVFFYISSCFFEYFLGFMHNEMLQALFVPFLPQSWNHYFSKRSLVHSKDNNILKPRYGQNVYLLLVVCQHFQTPSLK